MNWRKDCLKAKFSSSAISVLRPVILELEEIQVEFLEISCDLE